jgi:phosphotransacetylase
LPSCSARVVPFARLLSANGRCLLEVKGVVREIKTCFKKGLKVFKKRPAPKLEIIQSYTIRIWGFVGVCFEEGKCNFFECG